MRIQSTVCVSATLWPHSAIASQWSTSRVRPGLPVGAEARLERRRGGRGAEPRVAVHVRRADARLADHRERVVLLEEQLAARVEAEAAPAAGLLRAARCERSTMRPIAVSQSRLDEPPPSRTSGRVEPVGGVVRLPPEEILGSDAGRG